MSNRRGERLRGDKVPSHYFDRIGRRFRVGAVLLEGGRFNTPCRYLDLVTGLAVCDLLVHRSGLNARILEGGAIRPGDPVRPA